jgi:hypothetical protein
MNIFKKIYYWFQNIKENRQYKKDMIELSQCNFFETENRCFIIKTDDRKMQVLKEEDLTKNIKDKFIYAAEEQKDEYMKQFENFTNL